MRLDLTFSPTKNALNTVRNGLVAYNMAQVPALADSYHGEFAVLLHQDADIIAGALCEIDWNWLYYDAVWTAPQARGKGYGRAIMQAAEVYARQQHQIDRAYLYTTSFQARPFYEKIGYEWFGQVDDHPRGHQFYYLRKTGLSTADPHSQTRIEAPATKVSSSIIDNGLLTDISQTAPLNVRKICIFLRDDDNQIHGGMIGSQFWDWFDLHILWLDEAVRGEGWASAMLMLLERELKARDSLGILCDAADFQAIDFYQAHGFPIEGTLDERPAGHTSYFLKKQFS